MKTRSTLLIFALWVGHLVINPAAAFAQQPEPKPSNWRSTVACDSLVVYSQMSTQSRVVGHLKKGDQVNIDLEIIGSDGSWSIVTEPGKRRRLGHVQSDCLEREQFRPPVGWEARSLPPSERRPMPELIQGPGITAQKGPTKEEIEREVDRAVALRLNALMSETGTQQTATPAPPWFADGASFLFVPGFSRPFNFFPHRPTHFPRSLVPHFTPSVQIRSGSSFRRR